MVSSSSSREITILVVSTAMKDYPRGVVDEAVEAAEREYISTLRGFSGDGAKPVSSVGVFTLRIDSRVAECDEVVGKVLHL